MLNTNSKRTFKVVIITGGDVEVVTMSLYELLDVQPDGKDYEYKYALDEIIDAVLDLKPGEITNFQPNRDDQRSVGLITRWK